ncbi:MAG: hypothetical protein PWP65_845 [Clostridia bacterium]|nr:hypothetical protein [Clostridia bacterium]
MRLRLQYTKLGPARFLGHLDLMRLFQRAARRADLPLAYSAGFNPHPKLALGPALPLGMESEAEYLDLECTQEIPAREVQGRLQEQLPEGISVRKAKVIDSQTESLAAAIKCAAYRAELPPDVPKNKVEEAISRLSSQEKVLVKRKDKEVDIRQGIYDLKIEGDGGVFLYMLVACSQRLNVRPTEVMEALGLRATKPYVCRSGLFISCSPPLVTPLNEIFGR